MRWVLPPTLVTFFCSPKQYAIAMPDQQNKSAPKAAALDTTLPGSGENSKATIDDLYLKNVLNINTTKAYSAASPQSQSRSTESVSNSGDIMFASALNSGDVIHNVDIFVNKQLIPEPGQVGRLMGYGNKVQSSKRLIGAVRYKSADINHIAKDCGFIGIGMNQPVQSTYQNNNHAMVKFIGVERPIFAMNFGFVDIPVTLGYGYTTVGAEAQKTTEFGVIALNTFKVGTMGIEVLGGAYNAIIGNVIDGVNAWQHAYRLSGYQGAPCYGNAVTGNVSWGANHAYSFQKTAKYNAVMGFTAARTRGDAIEFTPVAHEIGSLESNVAELNMISGTIEAGPKAVYLLGGRANIIDIVAANQTKDAITVTKEQGGGDGSLNTIRGVIGNAGNEGLLINTDNNHVDMTIYNAKKSACVIAGDFNSGRINAYFSGDGVIVNGNNNMLFILSKGNSRDDLVIAGDNNVIICSGVAGCKITGKGNMIYGEVVTVNDTGKNNITSAMKGDMCRGKDDFQTDSDGYINITHGLKSADYLAFISITGDKGYYAQVVDTQRQTLKIRVFSKDGPLSSTTLNLAWKVEGGLGI